MHCGFSLQTVTWLSITPMYSSVRKFLPPFGLVLFSNFSFFFVACLSPKCYRSSNKLTHYSKTTQANASCSFYMNVLLLREKKQNQTYMARCGKVNLITGWAAFNKAFLATCRQSFFQLCWSFWPTHIHRIVLVQPHWRVFRHFPPF